MAVNWGSFLGRLRNKAIQQAPQTPQRTLQVTQSAPRKLAVTPTKQRQAPIPVSGAAPKITPQELVQISVLKLQQDSRKNPANKAANAAKINALLSNQGVKAGSSYETLRPKSVSDNVVSLLGGLAEFNPVRQVGSAGQFGGQVLETNPRVSKVGRFLQKASKPLAAFGDTKDTVADARLITNPAVKQVRKLVEFAGQTSNLALPGGLLINSAGQFGKTGTSTVEDLEAKGVSRKDAVKKAVPNAILQGAVEAVSSKFELSGRAKNIFIKAIINANVEGGEEAVQQLLDNAFKNNKLNEGVLEAYATGAVLGGVSSPIYSRLSSQSPQPPTQSRGSRKRTPASGIFAPSTAQGASPADTSRTAPIVGTGQTQLSANTTPTQTQSSRDPINKGIVSKSRDIIKGIVDFNTQLGQGGYVKVPTSTSAVASRLPVRLETNTRPSPQNPKVQQRPLQTPSTNTQAQADLSIKLKKGESAYVPAQDRRTLIDAIDHARGVLNLSEDSSIELQARAAEIAQKYGILQGKEPATFEKFADKIDQYLTRTKQQDYDYVPERRGAGILKKIKEYNSKMGQGGYVKVPGGDDNEMVKLPVRKQNDSNGGTTETINPDPSPEGVPSNGVKKVKLRDKIFRSTRSVIERQGKFGKKLADNLQKARDFEEVMQAQIMEGLPTVRSLKGKDFENFIEATQNGGSSDPKIQQAVNEWQAVHPKIREAGVNVGLDIGDLGPEYYPHFIDYELIFKDRSKYNEALNHLVQTGQAKDIADAIKKLSYARDVSRNRRFGNLESSRLIDLPFYDKTRNSLTSYIQGSTRRISQAAVFGKDDSKALDLIARATEEGYDGESMKNAYDVAVGAKQYNPNSKEASRKVRGYISTTRLGLGAITNTSQSVNTGIVTGHLRTLKSMVAQLDPKNREFVRKTGVVSDAIINDLREQQGFIGKTLGKITAPGFSQVEKFNRSVAAVAGRQYAMSLAKKGKVNTLRKLGVTGDIGTQLTEGQLIQAARKVVEKTQFKVDPQDLPGWVDTPWGRVVSQFRTFSYSQSKFVSNEILKPLAKGNVMPLSRFLAALPVGYALAEIKRLINNRPEEENKLRKDIEAVSNIGGLGLVMDIYRGMVPLNNKYLSSDRRVSMAVSTFGGPTAGTAAELVGAVSEVAQKKKLPKNPADMDNKVALGIDESGYRDATQLTRLGLRQIPIIGSRLQNTFVPYKPKSEKEKAAEASQPGLLDRIFGVKKADAGTEDKAEAARESETRLSAIKERQKSGQKLTALESDKLYWSMVDKLAKNQGKYMGMEPELSGELIRNARITPQARAKRYDDINNYLRLQVAQTAYKKSQKTITDKQEADKLRSLIKYDVALKNKINSVEALKEWQKTDEGKYKIELALFEHDKPNLTEAEIVKRTEKLNRIQNKSKPKAKKARLSKKSKVKSPKVKKLSLGTIRTSKIRSPRMKVKKVSYKKARKLPVKTA